MAGLDKPQIVTHVHKSLPFTLFDARWIPCSARFVVLGSHPRNTGALHVYEMSKGDVKLLAEAGRVTSRFHGVSNAALCQVEKRSAFKCGTFGATSLQERHLATGDFNGELMTWCEERLNLNLGYNKSIT